jgi:hypothetical protein
MNPPPLPVHYGEPTLLLAQIKFLDVILLHKFDNFLPTPLKWPVLGSQNMFLVEMHLVTACLSAIATHQPQKYFIFSVLYIYYSLLCT